jgi:hypothetical protein
MLLSCYSRRTIVYLLVASARCPDIRFQIDKQQVVHLDKFFSRCPDLMEQSVMQKICHPDRVWLLARCPRQR